MSTRSLPINNTIYVPQASKVLFYPLEISMFQNHGYSITGNYLKPIFGQISDLISCKYKEIPHISRKITVAFLSVFRINKK